MSQHRVVCSLTFTLKTLSSLSCMLARLHCWCAWIIFGKGLPERLSGRRRRRWSSDALGFDVPLSPLTSPKKSLSLSVLLILAPPTRLPPKRACHNEQHPSQCHRNVVALDADTSSRRVGRTAARGGDESCSRGEPKTSRRWRPQPRSRLGMGARMDYPRARSIVSYQRKQELASSQR